MSSANIPIDDLTVVEKLDLMEKIWVNLSQNPESIPSPDWHGSVLVKRLEAVEKGDIDFADWADAKKRLQQRNE